MDHAGNCEQTRDFDRIETPEYELLSINPADMHSVTNVTLFILGFTRPKSVSARVHVRHGDTEARSGNAGRPSLASRGKTRGVRGETGRNLTRGGRS